MLLPIDARLPRAVSAFSRASISRQVGEGAKPRHLRLGVRYFLPGSHSLVLRSTENGCRRLPAAALRQTIATLAKLLGAARSYKGRPSKRRGARQWKISHGVASSSPRRWFSRAQHAPLSTNCRMTSCEARVACARQFDSATTRTKVHSRNESQHDHVDGVTLLSARFSFVRRTRSGHEGSRAAGEVRKRK